MESSVLSSGERRSGKEAAVKQSIIQLILKWKLNSAEVEIQKNENVLSDPTRRELNRLIEQYRGYDKIMFSAQENCDKNPVTAKMMMAISTAAAANPTRTSGLPSMPAGLADTEAAPSPL